MRVKNLFLAVIFVLSILAPAYGADQRIQYNEKMVGANHPTLADTLNRALMVEHNTDGTHNKLTKVTDPWVDVRAYGAKGDGVTDDATAVQAALNSGATVVKIPKSSGAYVINSLVTIPAYTTLRLDGGTVTSSSATGVFSITLGINGTSGAIVGNGPQSIITYTGTGSAIQAIGNNQFAAGVIIKGLRVVGTSAGVSAINLKAFNRALVQDMEISGFTTGSGIKNEGANSVTFLNINSHGNLYGIWNLTAVVSSLNFTANACNVYSSQFTDNTGWGIFEDSTGGGGININNGAFGSVFERNGLAGSATSGHIFIRYATGNKYVGNYFESGAGITPVNSILIGDATNQPRGTVIQANHFLSTGATNTINNFNGVFTSIIGNTEEAVLTNFINNGTLSRNLFAGIQSAVSATNFFSGFDTGADSIVMNYSSTAINSLANTQQGLGFNSISGLTQDLAIRTRGGGTNATVWQASWGGQIGTMSASGQFSSADKIYPGTPTAAQQTAAGIYAGTGAPNNANGANGDFYFNAAGAAGTTIYQKRTGVWVGII